MGQWEFNSALNLIIKFYISSLLTTFLDQISFTLHQNNFSIPYFHPSVLRCRTFSLHFVQHLIRIGFMFPMLTSWKSGATFSNATYNFKRVTSTIW